MVLVQIYCLLRCIEEKFRLSASQDRTAMSDPGGKCSGRDPVSGKPEIRSRTVLPRGGANLFSTDLLELQMAGAKRRSPVKGPLLTFALMLGSVAAVIAVSNVIDSRQKAEQHTPTAVASDSSHPVTRQ
jgi:hypothetical protein